jgi:MarR family transcriptional regulator, transcriptional regulator for hemolysin
LDEFHRDLLFLLHDVARLLRVDADKRARLHGMTRAQWAILIWLERQPGISQKELSEILEVEPITVARLIDRLQTRGMVERRPDPRDRPSRAARDRRASRGHDAACNRRH